jgi:hypothetical protein
MVHCVAWVMAIFLIVLKLLLKKGVNGQKQ